MRVPDLYQGTTSVRIVHLKQGGTILKMTRFLRRSIRAFFVAVPVSALVWATLTTATGIALLFYRRRIISQLHLDVTRLLDWMTATHPLLARAIHIAKDITPDVLIVLLALAGLGYLMPEQVKRIESSKALRRIVAGMFFLFAALTIFLNEVDRIDKDSKQQESSGILRGRLGGCFALTRCHVFLGVYETVAEQRTRSFLHGLLLDLRASVVNGCSRTWGSTRAGLIGVRE